MTSNLTENKGLVIRFSEIDEKIKTRDHFVSAAQKNSIDQKLENDGEIMFLPSAHIERNMKSGGFDGYKIILCGVLQDGRKASVIICNIRPYFDICLNKKVNGVPLDEKAQVSEIRASMEQHQINIEKIVFASRRQFMLYNPNELRFMRIHVADLKTRKNAMYQAKVLGYSTATDDASHFCRIVCRDNELTFSQWSVLKKYKMFDPDRNPHQSVKGLVFETQVENFAPYKGELTEELKKDMSLTLAFDIETYSPDRSVPRHENPTHKIFCLGMTFQWAYKKEPFYKIVLCDLPAHPTEGVTTVICNTEENIIRAFGKIFAKFMPEFVLEFNGSDYDWPWIVHRAKETPGVLSDLATNMDIIKPWTNSTDDQIMQFNFRSKTIKISADTMHQGHSLDLNGYLTVDVRTSFRRLYPTMEQSSLKFFLSLCTDGAKEDLSYAQLFEYYSNALEFAKNHPPKNGKYTKLTADDEKKANAIMAGLAEINKYCVVDAFMCHKLLSSRYVIMDNRELANLCYVPLADSFYAAGGVKVKNLTISVGQKNPFRLRFTNNTEDLEKTKYKGAFVFPPKKELKISKLSIEERIQKAILQNDYYNDKFDENAVEDSKDAVEDSKAAEDSKDAVEASKDIENTVEDSKDTVEDAVDTKSDSEDSETDGPVADPNTDGLDAQVEPKKKQKFEKPKKVKNIKPRDLFTRKYTDWLSLTDKQKQFLHSIIEKDGIYFPTKSYINALAEHGDDIYKTQNIKIVCLEEIEEKYKAEIQKTFGSTTFPQYVRDFFTEKTGRPITGLDYSSLYPSIIRAYNLSPEYCIKDPREAKKAQDAGHLLSKVTFTFKNRNIVGYFIWHDNVYEYQKPDGTVNPKFKFGIFPYILNDVFNRRAAVKKLMKPYAALMEKYKGMAKADKVAIQNEIDENTFMFNYYNSKQNALKVFMNTFYGVCGSVVSPFYLLEVANGTTSLGQLNIKLAYTLVRTFGCDVHYGDTDSLYISMPEKCFEKIDKEFYSGKLDKEKYWTELVKITFDTIQMIRDKVNKALEENNGTKFLSMAYEEVLWPAAFLAKKKYYGIPHEHKIAFHIEPKDLFVRGLEVKKRGVSSLLREICFDILMKSVSMNNIYDLIELVKLSIHKIYTSEWDIKYFIQTAEYKPEKNNVKVQTCVKRMLDEYKEVIAPNQRFEYVLVKKYPYTYDERGCVSKLSVGDKMVLVDVAKRENLQIDLDYYLEGSIIGQFGRLITWYDIFQIDCDTNDAEELKKVEETILNNAKKFVTDYCGFYATKYNKLGATYKQIFKVTNTAIGGAISNRDPLVSKLLTASVDDTDFAKWMQSMCEKEAAKLVPEDYGEASVKAHLGEVLEETKTTKAKAAKRKATIDMVQEELTEDQKKKIKELQQQQRKEKAAVIAAARKQIIHELQVKYFGSKNSEMVEKKKQFDANNYIFLRELSANFNKIAKVYIKHRSNIEHLNDIIKSKLPQVNLETETEIADLGLQDFGINPDDYTDEIVKDAEKRTEEMWKSKEIQEAIDILKDIYTKMRTNYINYTKYKYIIAYLQQLRDKEVRYIRPPTQERLEQIKKETLNEELEEVAGLDLVN